MRDRAGLQWEHLGHVPTALGLLLKNAKNSKGDPYLFIGPALQKERIDKW